MSEYTIYVGSLSTDTTEETLRNHFFACGEIAKVTLLKHQETGLSRGFGFIKFNDIASRDKALEYNGMTLDGHTIKVNVPNKKQW